MAELKVDKILPATGSSVSLSESGKTVLIPSGATLDASAATVTGMGAKVDYCSSLKTSPFTASASRGYFINTGSAVTVTLPSSPSVGDQIIVIDATGNASSNAITLAGNGSKIKGQCGNAELQTDRVGVRIVYSGSSQGWLTATSANETAPTLATAQYVAASGGTETTSGNFKIHTFTSDGTLTVSSGGNSLGSNTVSYVVVAGGGATQGYSSKGGGAGGYREGLGLNDSFTGSPLRSPTGVPVSAQAYPITVGGGGSGGPANYPSTATSAQKGNDSIFSTITSTGGGSGTGGSVTRPAAVGNGGSGGNGASGNEPPVSPPQGNDGGPSGGGGAGEAGDTDGSGQGGDGVSSEITGSAVTRAGGGGGGGGVGGDGGGGPSVGGSSGTFQPGTSGTANTGGGAGGGSDWSSSAGSGNASGGSGIVIIRYKFQN